MWTWGTVITFASIEIAGTNVSRVEAVEVHLGFKRPAGYHSSCISLTSGFLVWTPPLSESVVMTVILSLGTIRTSRSLARTLDLAGSAGVSTLPAARGAHQREHEMNGVRPALGAGRSAEADAAVDMPVS